MEKKESKDYKVKLICDSLRKDTLEPAKLEAERIILEAEQKAAKMLADAEEQAESLHAQVLVAIDKERNIFYSSLDQAAKQSLETLRQKIETKFFNQELEMLIGEVGVKPSIISELIQAIIQALDKEGLEANFEVVIPRAVPAEEISALLGDRILKRLSNKISIGNFDGGVQVKLVDKKMMLDITDAALKELIGNYVRKDFRKMIFVN